MQWRQNPHRVAWTILIANLAVCCVLAVAVPLAGRSFVLHSTRALKTSLATTAGTVQIQVPGALEPNAVPERRDVPEGSQVITDELAQALLTISSDESGGSAAVTVRVLQNTSLSLVRAQTPRFGASIDPSTLLLKLERGRVRLAMANTSARPIRAVLQTPQGEAVLSGAAFDVAVRNDETQVTALEGSAVVSAAGRSVTVEDSQRVVVAAGRAPNLPVPAEQNIIRNGNFVEDLASTWQQVIDVPAGHEPGSVTRETEDHPRVHLLRRAEDGVPNSAGISQTLKTDVQGHDSLVLQLDLLCLHQSVPGGGELSSEYPIKVDIAYTDIYGKSLHWFQGFYCQDLPPGSSWQRPTGQQVSVGVWYTYESPNLIQALSETRPARVDAITILANGHDYESMVSDVALIAR